MSAKKKTDAAKLHAIRGEVEGDAQFRTSVLMSQSQNIALKRAALELEELGTSTPVTQLIREGIDLRLRAHAESMRRLGRRPKSGDAAAMGAFAQEVRADVERRTEESSRSRRRGKPKL